MFSIVWIKKEEKEFPSLDQKPVNHFQSSVNEMKGFVVKEVLMI